MDLCKSVRRNYSEVSLENDAEAYLFAYEGLGILSLRAIRLSLNIIRARADDKWPIIVNVPDNRLLQAADHMSDEASRLSVVGQLPGFGDYPYAVENEFALRNMSASIRQHLTTKDSSVDSS